MFQLILILISGGSYVYEYFIKTKKSITGGIDMKGNSDTYPEIVILSNGKKQVRYNILETIKEDMIGESRLSYDFDYVEIEGEVTRDKIIIAIISNIYLKDDEVALINNEMANPGTLEYKEYQLFRTKTKEIADEVIKLVG